MRACNPYFDAAPDNKQQFLLLLSREARHRRMTLVHQFPTTLGTRIESSLLLYLYAMTILPSITRLARPAKDPMDPALRISSLMEKESSQLLRSRLTAIQAMALEDRQASSRVMTRVMTHPAMHHLKSLFLKKVLELEEAHAQVKEQAQEWKREDHQ